MSSGKLRRYDTQFLRDFRGPIVVQAIAEEQVVAAPPPPPPAPTFKEADLDQAREAGKKLGYAEGFEAGIAQATTEATNREKEMAATVSRINDQMARLIATYRKLVAEQSVELTDLVIGISRKVAGEALDKSAEKAIAGVVERCLPLVLSKPRIAIELSPDIMRDIEPLLRRRLEEGGYEGSVEFRTNEALEPHDVRVDWMQGQAQRSTKMLWQEIEALLQQMPPSPTVPIVFVPPSAN